MHMYSSAKILTSAWAKTSSSDSLHSVSRKVFCFLLRGTQALEETFSYADQASTSLWLLAFQSLISQQNSFRAIISTLNYLNIYEGGYSINGV